MMKKIKVEEILKRHYVSRGDELQQIKLRMAIRELINTALEKAASGNLNVKSIRNVKEMFDYE